MQVKIAGKLHPFSHAKEVTCLIPGSPHIVRIYPTLLRYQDKEIRLPIAGPVKNFTVVLDLERECIVVFGHAANGFKRYCISYRSGEMVVDFDKIPPVPVIKRERLSLGNHRLQDWARVIERHDFSEIFPAWLRLSELSPEVVEKEAYLLKQIHEAKSDKNRILEAFSHLFHAHFTGILTPRLRDEEYQGLIPESENLPEGCPLFILKQGAKLIRSLFIEDAEKLALLPALPREFHAGRFIDIRLKSGDVLHMEWSAKQLRRVVWHPASDQVRALQLQSCLRSFRLRTCMKDKGVQVDADTSLHLKAGQVLYLDRFQK
jgi:hypothetical protein